MFTLTLNIYLFVRYIIDMILTNLIKSTCNKLIDRVYFRTRLESRFRFWSARAPVLVLVEFGLVPLHYWFQSGTGRFGRYQTGTAIFYVVFRFYDELPASRAPPVLWLDHVHPSTHSSSQTVSRASLEFTKCIMPRSPPPLWRHLERNIIFILTVCYFYWFHIKHRHFRINILLDKLICHKFYTLTWKSMLIIN